MRLLYATRRFEPGVSAARLKEQKLLLLGLRTVPLALCTCASDALRAARPEMTSGMAADAPYAKKGPPNEWRRESTDCSYNSQCAESSFPSIAHELRASARRGAIAARNAPEAAQRGASELVTMRSEREHRCRPRCHPRRQQL